MMKKRKFKGSFGILPRVENDGRKREEAIKKNIPVRFEIVSDPVQKNEHNIIDDIYNLDILGTGAVQKHDKRILKYSQKHNIDPDIVRAVMFAENARGHKGGINASMDIIKKSESPLPMNIQKNRWGSLIDKKPEDLYDPDNNVEAATVLLRRISGRVEKPTAAKIGSIWHYTGTEKTDEFGKYVGRVYEEKPWRKIE